jgi:hypothetical protein
VGCNTVVEECIAPVGTSHMLLTSVTDQSNNRKRLRSLLEPTHKSANLQVFIAMQRLVDNISTATHMRNNTHPCCDMA